MTRVGIGGRVYSRPQVFKLGRRSWWVQWPVRGPMAGDERPPVRYKRFDNWRAAIDFALEEVQVP